MTKNVDTINNLPEKIKPGGIVINSNGNTQEKPEDIDTKFQYVNASIGLIRDAMIKLSKSNPGSFIGTITDNVAQQIQKNNDAPVVKKIEEMLVPPYNDVKQYAFLFENDEMPEEKKEILFSTIKKVLNALKKDWTLPSWIETFKSWLFKYNDAEYLTLKKLGINRYKKNIKGFIYKSFLENDPNLRYLIAVSGADEGTLSSVENAFIELKNGINEDFNEDKKSKKILDYDIIYNQKKIKNWEEIAKEEKEAKEKEEKEEENAKVVKKETNEKPASGGKKSKSRRTKQYKKSHNPKNKKSHKNQHKNKKRK
jgi:hypothetical protein